MRKAERLFQLLTLLRGRRTVLTARAMAEVLEVSERTVYRDIQALSLSGVPIEGEAGVGYRLRPDFDLPPLMFDLDELEALLLGVRLVQGCSDEQLGSAASRVLDKVRAALPRHLHGKFLEKQESLIVPGMHRQWATQFSDQIRSAIKEHRVVNIRYQREDKQLSQREVWPLGLIYWGTIWTLIGWCELRSDYRMFRLDRIKALESTGRCFQTTDEINLQTYMSRARHDVR